jgi:GDP-4-dehydro-6-deoxy-D-mannose reductase
MKRILITGIDGFFGRYLHQALAPEYEVYGVQRTATAAKNIYVEDITHAKALHEIILAVAPDAIIHLAASLKDNKKTMFKTNVEGFKNVLDGTREYSKRDKKTPVVFFANSSAIYDPREANPVSEDANLSPTSYYGLTKYINMLTAQEYCQKFNLRIVGMRMFNLCGPGQNEQFVISGFCRQLAERCLDSDNERAILSGGLNFVRDFVDVRDAAAAVQLMLKGQPCSAQAYEFYNICSGIPTKIYDIVKLLKELVGFGFEVREKTILENYSEIVESYGSYEKIKQKYKWEPQIPLRQSVRDTFEYWMKRLKES